MKRSKLSLFLLGLLTLIAIAIAIPSFTIDMRGNTYTVKGIDPKDFDSDFVLSEFSLRTSLDLHGGYMAIYDVDLADAEDKDAQFAQAYKTMSERVAGLGIGDYELSSLVDTDNSDYKIVVKYADDVPQEIMASLASRGELGAWTINYSQAVDENGVAIEDPFVGTIFEGRRQTPINNSSVSYTKVVSDSRIFLASYLAGYIGGVQEGDLDVSSNYGLLMTFTPEAAGDLYTALSTNSNGISPVLLSIDGEPMGYQASGFTFNPSSPSSDVLVYTFVPDTKLYNQFLATLINTDPLDSAVVLDGITTVAPGLGVHAQRNIFIGIGVGLAIIGLATGFIYRKRSLILILSTLIYIILFIALLEIFSFASAAFSFALITGAVLGMIVFLSFMILFIQRIKQVEQYGVTSKELEHAYNTTRDDYRNLLFLFIFVAFVLQAYGDGDINQFATGMGFGVITGILIIITAVKALSPYIFLTEKQK